MLDDDLNSVCFIVRDVVYLVATVKSVIKEFHSVKQPLCNDIVF